MGNVKEFYGFLEWLNEIAVQNDQEYSKDRFGNSSIQFYHKMTLGL